MTTCAELQLAYDGWKLAHDLMLHELGFAPQPQVSESWLALVAAKEASGLSRVVAIRQAGRERPDLYNAQSILKVEPTPTPPALDPGRAQWEALVNTKMAGGLSKVEAIVAAMRQAAGPQR